MVENLDLFLDEKSKNYIGFAKKLQKIPMV